MPRRFYIWFHSVLNGSSRSISAGGCSPPVAFYVGESDASAYRLIEVRLVRQHATTIPDRLTQLHQVPLRRFAPFLGCCAVPLWSGRTERSRIRCSPRQLPRLSSSGRRFSLLSAQPQSSLKWKLLRGLHPSLRCGVMLRLGVSPTMCIASYIVGCRSLTSQQVFTVLSRSPRFSDRYVLSGLKSASGWHRCLSVESATSSLNMSTRNKDVRCPQAVPRRWIPLVF